MQVEGDVSKKGLVLVVSQALVLAVGARDPADLVQWALDAHVSALGVGVDGASPASVAALLVSESAGRAWLASDRVSVEGVGSSWASLAGTVLEQSGSGWAGSLGVLVLEHGADHVDDLLDWDLHLLLHPPRAWHGEEPVVLLQGFWPSARTSWVGPS